MKLLSITVNQPSGPFVFAELLAMLTAGHGQGLVLQEVQELSPTPRVLSGHCNYFSHRTEVQQINVP